MLKILGNVNREKGDRLLFPEEGAQSPLCRGLIHQTLIEKKRTMRFLPKSRMSFLYIEEKKNE